MTPLQRITGCIVGGAIGDAFGAPVEFDEHPNIDEPPDPALYTDDTQLTVRVAEGLLAALDSRFDRTGFGESSAKYVAEQIIAWDREDPPRAPGAACLHGAAALAADQNHPSAWRTAGMIDGKGCGSAMRSAPYGLLLPRDVGIITAGDHALMTHRHPSAQAASAAVAAGVRAAIDGLPPREIAWRAVDAARRFDRETSSMITEAFMAVFDRDCDRAAEIVDPLFFDQYRGWKGDEAVTAALYAFLRHPNDFDACVRLAANTPGDSDSIASIAGNLAGAHLGIGAINAEWVARIENRDYLFDLSKRMAIT